MDIWVNMNKKNTFKNDFFLSNNAKEIWSTKMNSGIEERKTYTGNLVDIKLRVPPGSATTKFIYE